MAEPWKEYWLSPVNQCNEIENVFFVRVHILCLYTRDVLIKVTRTSAF